MSRLQKIIILGAACNAFLLLLVPPYDVVAIDRRLMFDAFYPAFAIPPGRIIDLYVLFNVFAGLTVNAALAWLVLGRAAGPAISPRRFVLLLGAANLAIVLLFAPMAIYPFSPDLEMGVFDGFSFVFAMQSPRDVYVPLLTLEVIYIAINVLAFWLLVGAEQRAPAYEPGPRTMFEEAAELIERAEEKLASRKRDESAKDEGKPS
jgi:hypothetical protein